MSSHPDSRFIVPLVLKALLGPFVRAAFRMKAKGIQSIPKTGPLVMVANHSSYLDPVLLTAVCPRFVRFFVLESVYDLPWLKGLLKASGTVPVRGKSTRGALVAGAEILRRGEVLGLFPEGERSFDGRIGRGHAGAALLARSNDAPVLPVAIVGAYESFPRWARVPRLKPVTVVFGEPHLIGESADEGRDGLRRETDLIMASIQDLLDGEKRGRNMEYRM